MAHSIEVRVPFLDYRLVNLVFGMSADWRMRGPWNKFVLREAMRGSIPESVRTRVDKMGFPISNSDWVSALPYEPIRDILSSQQARERGIYRVEAILNDVERYRRGETNCTRALFEVVQFELWCQLLNTQTAVPKTVIPSRPRKYLAAR